MDYNIYSGKGRKGNDFTIMKKLPHILIFNPDQWRGDVLGHMGNPAAVTPNLDQFVMHDAVSFRHAFCQHSVCTPSRSSFMTGWYPHVRGHRSLFHMLHMELDEPILLKTLKENGYFVWWGGKNDLIPGNHNEKKICDVRFKPDASSRSYTAQKRDLRGDPDGDNYYSFYYGKINKNPDEEIYLDNDWLRILAAIEHIKKTPKDQPQCIYLSLIYPHPPYRIEEPYYSMIDRAKIPPRTKTPSSWEGKPSMLKGLWNLQNMKDWTEGRFRELQATYYGMCARVDDQFGRVISALKEAGMYDDTAIFFFSDHGDFTGDYGIVEKAPNVFPDCLTRVPFLVKPPKGIPVQPRVSNALVELIDFPATVEALTGIKPKHTHFGKSLLPVISGETDEHRDAAFCEGGRLHGEIHCMEAEGPRGIDKKMLYWPKLSMQRSEGPEHTKAVMVRTKEYKYIRRLYEQDELYDLKRDSREECNRIDDPTLRDTLANLKERLLTFFLETGDVVPHETDER